MLTPTQRTQVKADVVAAYQNKYPSWTSIKITEIIENIYFGILVSVSADQSSDGEICIYRKDGVIIFETTPEMIRYLDMKAQQVISLRDWLAAIVVIVVLILFFITVFVFKKPEAIQVVITAMVGILGAYAGIASKSKTDEK